MYAKKQVHNKLQQLIKTTRFFSGTKAKFNVETAGHIHIAALK